MASTSGSSSSSLWSLMKRVFGGTSSKKRSFPNHLRTDHFGDPTRNYNEVNRRPYSYSNGYLVETVGEEHEGDTRELDDTEHHYYPPPPEAARGKREHDFQRHMTNGGSKQDDSMKRSSLDVSPLPINPDPFLHPYDRPDRMTLVLEPVRDDTIVLQ